MNRENVQRHDCAAFSLVELLVVLSIISVLFALLLPGLEQAMQQSRLTACANQQKQVYLGVMAYAEQNGYRGPDWNGHCGWSPMSSMADPYLKSCQLGRILSSGCMEKELLVDPGFINNTETGNLVYRGEIRWNRVSPVPNPYQLPVNWTSGTYSMYLWSAEGGSGFAKIRRLDKPINFPVTLCRQDSLTFDIMNHERKMMNACYEDGHIRTIDAAAGHAEMIIRNVDAKNNGSASALGYNWWNWARDRDK